MKSTMFGIVLSIPALALAPSLAAGQGLAATESDARIAFEGSGSADFTASDVCLDLPSGVTATTDSGFALPSCSTLSAAGQGPTFLDADGQTDTYRLISSALGGNPIEAPDCSHPDFGPHITQEWASELGKYSFVFYLHLSPDNDRCVDNSKQRNEIKTYNHSPDYLKGFFGDSLTYRWRFKLDDGFQPSREFTHIHQIKSDEQGSQPLITLTPRAGNPDQLQLIHIDSTGARTIVTTADLSAFKGVWVEAYERITVDSFGTYSIQITSVSEGTLLLSYGSENLDMWRHDATFVRPKWGIYRSISESAQPYLRDELVRFDSFCLAKGSDDC